MSYKAVFQSFWFLCFLGMSFLMDAQPTRLVAERMAELDYVIEVLSFSNAPNEDRLLVMCQDGRIWVFEDGAILDEPFFDIGETGLDILDFGIGSEEGLIGIALDPDYDTNGFFYLTYNGFLPDGSGDNLFDWHLVAFKRSDDDPYKADLDWWSEVLTIPMIRRGHNGGKIAFGQDGYLYVSVGDGGATGTGAPGGGSGGDIDNNAQNTGVLLGSILRLDVEGDAPYGIPDDNPFVDDENARDEIWAYGLRNPWRWSFDRLTGDLYVGDVGEVDWEEISMMEADESAVNFGWRLLEGSNCYEPVVDCDPNDETRLPLYDYAHSETLCSVIGGYVYRGSAIPSLYGNYIYSDACGFGEEKFWLIYNDGISWVNQWVEVDIDGGFLPFGETRFGFGEDNQGELYICTRIGFSKIVADPDFDTTAKENPIFLAPNPADQYTRLDLGGPFFLDRIEVYDNTGRQTLQLVPNGPGLGGYRIDTSAIPSGVYTLRVFCRDTEEPRTTRLVVTHAQED